MAGAGYKLFNTGDVLTAAQVNTYLNEQTVMVFASSAARTSALSGVLAEGMVSYLQDTNAVEVYNGSAWVGVSGAGDVTEVQAGTGISVASGTGPIPVVTNTMATAVDAKGDLIVGTGSDTFARLAVGTNGYTLVADSAETTGLKWAAAAGGGFTLLSTTTLTSTTVTISDISQSYKHLFLYCKGVTSSNNGEALQLRFNGDTDSDYHYGYVRNIGTTVAGSFQTENKIQLIDRLQSTSTVSKLGSCGFWVFRYTDTDYIDGQGQALGNDGTNGYNSSISYRYDTGAAITSITLFPSGAGTQGGTAYLYGVN